MSKLNSRQRKTVWFVAIIVLMIPIVTLGMPRGRDTDSTGGVLAQLRTKHDLGESDLGQIDPTSAAMNLLLLGLRGVAVNVLRMDLDYYKDRKEWSQMRSTTEAVITLQPHYIGVWRYLSWNLSYNVSAEWDSVKDRYYWVKEGGKFSQRGTRHNQRVPELCFETGRIWGAKVGRSDEWEYFRQYFVNDPFLQEEGGDTSIARYDQEINPDQKDNYLVARDWYVRANELELKTEQHMMMRALFRSYPARSRLDMADAFQREGRFGKATVDAWDEAFDEWTQSYGKMPFRTVACILWMEADQDDVAEMARQSETSTEVIRDWLSYYQNVTNYRYWRVRALAESEPETGEAHRLLHEGEERYEDGDLDAALDLLERGLVKYEAMLERHPELTVEDLSIEEGLWAVLIWRKIYQINQEPIPADFPLKALWQKEQQRIPILQADFDSQGL